jgi:hypothetical protein
MATTSRVWVDRHLDRLPQPRTAGRRWGFLAPKKPVKQMLYSEAEELVDSLIPYRRDVSSMEDAIGLVSLYRGSPENVGSAKHAFVSEAYTGAA